MQPKEWAKLKQPHGAAVLTCTFVHTGRRLARAQQADRSLSREPVRTDWQLVNGPPAMPWSPRKRQLAKAKATIGHASCRECP